MWEPTVFLDDPRQSLVLHFAMLDDDGDFYDEIVFGVRGHPIYRRFVGDTWKWVDTRTEISVDAHLRPCALCGKAPVNDHDACIADTPGVIAACCGHGDPRGGYMLFENGRIIRGFNVVEERREGDDREVL